MHRLTQTQLRRHLDDAIEIIRPVAGGLDAVEILMGLLMLKRASDKMSVGDVKDAKGGEKDAQSTTEAESKDHLG